MEKEDFVFRYMNDYSLEGNAGLVLRIPALGVYKLYDSLWLADHGRFFVPELVRRKPELLMQTRLDYFIENCITKIRRLSCGQPFLIPLGIYGALTDYLVVEKTAKGMAAIRYGYAHEGSVDLFTLDQSRIDHRKLTCTHGPKTVVLEDLLNGFRSNLGNQN